MAMYIKKGELNDDIILKISNALKDGKLVVFPTDTVYGIGTNVYDGVACEKIYAAKGRPKYKPLIVLISEISMLHEIVDSISPVEQKLVDIFWLEKSEALTIKFRKKQGIFPGIVSAGDDYLRVRFVNKGIAATLIRKAGVPVVAPSANLSGSPTGIKIENIVSELGEKVDYILDCGDVENDVTSTIVQVEDEKILVIREGKIKKEELSKIAPLMVE